MFGSVVIRSKSDPMKQFYDVDDPNHVLVITDWLEDLGISKFINHHHTEVRIIIIKMTLSISLLKVHIHKYK